MKQTVCLPTCGLKDVIVLQETVVNGLHKALRCRIYNYNVVIMYVPLYQLPGGCLS